MPVLENDGSVVGFVTVDDVIDVLSRSRPRRPQDAAIEGGALDKPYFQNSIPRGGRKRIGWLLLLFVAETFTGTVLRPLQAEWRHPVVALSFFIPLLIGTGGNAAPIPCTISVSSLAPWENPPQGLLARADPGGHHGMTIGLLLVGHRFRPGADVALPCPWPGPWP